MKKLIAIAIILLMLDKLGLFAQIPGYYFDRISTNQGLSQSSITCFLQDSQGFMWIGTTDGLNKYDGYEFIEYHQNELNQNHLSSGEIMKIVEDSLGYIWIMSRGFETTLDVLNPKDGTITNLTHEAEDSTSISHNTITDICVSKDGNLWINAYGTLNKVSYGTNNEFKFTQHFHLEYLDWKMFEDSRNNFLIFADSIYIYDIENDQLSEAKVIVENSSPETSFSEDSKGSIWIGTQSTGILKFNYDAQENSYVQELNIKCNLTPTNRNILCIDKEDRIWITTEMNENGLILYDIKTDSITSFIPNEFDPNSISDIAQIGIYIDRSDILWIGTFSQGICKLNLLKKPFVNYLQIPGEENSLSGKVISAIHGINDNDIWVGIDVGGGVNRILLDNNQNHQIIHYQHDSNNPQSLGGDNVLSLWQRRNGDVWVGSAFHFTTKIIPHGTDQPQHVSFTDKSTMMGWKFCMFEDQDKILWAGAFSEGLIRFNNDENSADYFIHDPNNENSIIDNCIWSISEDNAGNLWIGSRGKGISILPMSQKLKDDPLFVNIKPRDGNTNTNFDGTINVIFQDSRGIIWIGTSLGLNMLQLTNYEIANIDKVQTFQLKSYFQKDGLPNDYIAGIAEDNKGNLWISTQKGISKFDLTSEKFTNYDYRDGLQGNEFRHNAYFKDSKGRIYFGGNNGITAFYPDSIKLNPNVPNLAFTDFKLFNKSVEVGSTINGQVVLTQTIQHTKNIVLSYKNDAIAIEFASLNYANPNKNQYMYKMDGLDAGWIKTSSDRRFSYYSNLNPGSYTFRVKGSNNDGVWNEEGIALNITVLPPWWKTLLFRILFIAFIVGLLGLAFYTRIQFYKNQHIILEEQVSTKTSELKTAIDMLFHQTEELNERNKLLEKNKTVIEEQNEELLSQKESLLKANMELVALNATKDKFFSIIAHDLRNPFNNIIGFSELLEENFEFWEEDRKIEAIKVILTSSKDLFQLLENLLTWAKTQRGNIEYTPTEFYLEQAISKAIKLMTPLAEAKTIQLVQNISHNGLKVLVDESMLDTVLRNLIGNAIKFTNPGGKIEVRAVKNGNKVEIDVIDNGVGMTQESQQRLFKIESNRSTPGTKDETGTGLGLILVHDFVAKMGGQIQVESAPGEGSKFSFSVKST